MESVKEDGILESFFTEKLFEKKDCSHVLGSRSQYPLYCWVHVLARWEELERLRDGEGNNKVRKDGLEGE